MTKTLPHRALVGWVRWSGGALFVLGLLALFRGHFDNFTGHEGVPLIGFDQSPLTSTIHFLAAIALIGALGSLARMRFLALYGGIAFTVFGLLELALGNGSADIFGRNTRMMLLDLVIGVIGIAVALWERSDSRVRATKDATPGA